MGVRRGAGWVGGGLVERHGGTAPALRFHTEISSLIFLSTGRGVTVKGGKRIWVHAWWLHGANVCTPLREGWRGFKSQRAPSSPAAAPTGVGTARTRARTHTHTHTHSHETHARTHAPARTRTHTLKHKHVRAHTHTLCEQRCY